jgi:hypothetical protein
MEDGNLLDFGQTGVIAVNHVMEDLDGEHEKGAVPTQVQSMGEKTLMLNNFLFLLITAFMQMRCEWEIYRVSPILMCTLN